MANFKYKSSVIIPVYKTEKYIEECVRTLFGQTLKEVEFIFIDDCSQDKCIEIVQSCLNEYPQRKQDVKFIHHCTNMGVCRTIYDGIMNAEGEYVIRCDSDDYVDKKMYEELYHEAKRSSSDIVCCGYMDVSQRGKNIIKTVHSVNEINTYNKLMLGCFSRLPLAGSLCNKMIKNEIIKKLCSFLLDFPGYLEDSCLVASCLDETKKITFIDNNFYFYRLVPESITHTHSHSKILQAEYIFINYLREKAFFERNNLNDVYLMVLRRNFLEAILICQDVNYDIIRNFIPNIKRLSFLFGGHLPIMMRICLILTYICPHLTKSIIQRRKKN